MRKLIYYVACSVDGYIAHTDGSHDGFSQDLEYLTEVFTSFPETVPAHLRDAMGIQAANRWFDTVLMGRNTYEIGVQAGVLSPYPHMRQYLFSNTLKESPHPDITLVFDNVSEVVQQLKQEHGKDIWLCGGGKLATSLFEHHLLDRLILKVNPFLMGSGISLFTNVIDQTALTLTDHKAYENGVLMLDYQIVN